MPSSPQAPVEDPLLLELNGALARTGEPTLLDGPQVQPAPLADRLEVGPASRPQPTTPRAQLADKTHAVSKGGFGYRVIVEGEYYARSTEANGRVIKNYSLPFNLPSLTNAKGEAALGIIVGKLLKPALMKLDPLAITYHTHVIASVTALAGAPEPTSLQYMSFEALKTYVRDNDIPLDPDEYWDVEHLREDVIDLRINMADGKDAKTGASLGNDGAKEGKGFGNKKSPLERVRERHEVRKEEKVLRDMNDGL